jgi:two-component system, sporulation sensor kinase E
MEGTNIKEQVSDLPYAKKYVKIMTDISQLTAIIIQELNLPSTYPNKMEILKKPYRILVVDDDEEDYLLITDFISELGPGQYVIEWAPNFKAGSEIMKQARHDIYLIDHFLGAGTGIELITEASNNGCKTPKILLTGVGNLEIDMLAIKAGAYDYLPKTLLSTEMLERTLRHSIERYEQSILFENQQARFKNLFEQSIDPIYITDEDWNLTDANNSLLDLFKLKYTHINHFKLYDLFNDPIDFKKLKEQISKESFATNFACLLQTTDGEKKMICLVSASPIRNFQGHTTGYQGMIRDITQLKKAEKELLQVEQINLTGRMARIIAHEVRNPLTNINLATDELGSQMQEQEQTVLYTEIIKRSSERINNLISDLLNSTRLANPVMVSTEIEKILNEALLLCDDRLQLKRIKLTRIGFNNTTSINVDKDKLKLAFVNIITNAIEAMNNTESPELKLEIVQHEKELFIKIGDNGRGMDEHTLKHLFEPFFTARNGGMGLGMTTVQNIIIQHHGNISVESMQNKGTTFTVSLPLN